MSSIKDIVKSTNIANTIGAGQGLLNKYGISNILGTKTIPAEVGTGLVCVDLWFGKSKKFILSSIFLSMKTLNEVTIIDTNKKYIFNI